MSGFGGCYDYDTTAYTYGKPSHSDNYNDSWLLPVLLLFAALFFCGGFSWIFILLGIILLFGKDAFNFKF